MSTTRFDAHRKATAWLLVMTTFLAGCAANVVPDPRSPRSRMLETVRDTPVAQQESGVKQTSAAYRKLVAQAKKAETSGDLAEAVALYKQAIALDAQAVDGYVGLGIMNAKQKRLTAAEHYLGMSLEIEPDNAAALGYMGVVRDLQQSFEQAEYYHSSATKLAPTDATLLNNYGFSLLMQGKPAEAESLFRRALAEEKENAGRITNNLVIALARQARYDEALDLQVKTMDKKSALNNIGYIAMMNVDYDIAEKYFRDAIAAEPKGHEPAQANMRRLAELMAELEQARANDR